MKTQTHDEQELRELAHRVMNADTPYDAINFIQVHTVKAVSDVLDRLEEQKAEYQDCITGEHNWQECTCPTEDAVPLSAIHSERQKLTHGKGKE